MEKLYVVYCLNVPFYNTMVSMTPKRQFKEYYSFLAAHEYEQTATKKFKSQLENSIIFWKILKHFF